MNVIELHKREEKMTSKEAGYSQKAEFPFVCGTCVHYGGGDMTCDIVEGPHPGGKVFPHDTCDHWKPGSGLGKATA